MSWRYSQVYDPEPVIRHEAAQIADILYRGIVTEQAGNTFARTQSRYDERRVVRDLALGIRTHATPPHWSLSPSEFQQTAASVADALLAHVGDLRPQDRFFLAESQFSLDDRTARAIEFFTLAGMESPL